MRRMTILLAAATLFATVLPVAAAEPPTERDVPEHLTDLKLSRPLSATSSELLKLDPSLLEAEGTVTVAIQLTEEAVAESNARGSSVAQQRTQATRVEAQQRAINQKVRQLDSGAVERGSVSNALNAVFVDVDASALEELANDPRVEGISRVIDYERDLTETVPHIGGTVVHEHGVIGSGVRVAVLDSGIDYTHASLGGSGLLSHYQHAAANPTVVTARLFPTQKVVGGYDFVGSNWTGATGSPPLAPDPNPIDDGPAAGHGTHVADIIGGVKGVAPGTQLYAVKVCSSVSTSCSGIALLQGIDFALDPEWLGHTDNPVDIINMSLGANYGQAFDNAVAQAVENASAIGVLTVASAGNASDKPYVTGTPGAAHSALSVAQTQVPSANLQLIYVEGPGEIPGVFQPWAVLPTETITGEIIYGNGAGGNLLGCDPFAPGSLTGYIVLVDRGACNFTLKAQHIGDAGGAAAVIGLVTPEAPFAGGDGGEPVTIPAYMIGMPESQSIKAALPTKAVIDPENVMPLTGQIVGSSSRGPTMQGNLIKPEIGAPGASVSAIAGTGTGEGPFGGTSGAAPMVSGSAALLMEAYPNRRAYEIKAVLINTGETDIEVDPFSGKAPITRIGGGEVRVDRALKAAAAAWDTDAPSAALSFGFLDANGNNHRLHKTVTVRNYTNQRIQYDIANEFRFDDDQLNGAVQVTVSPSRLNVRPNSEATFRVTMRVDGGKLRQWALNSGAQGANGALLSVFEYDGYLRLTEVGNSANTLHLPWHVLPRKSGDVTLQETANPRPERPAARLRNGGVGATTIEAYSLLGVSPDFGSGGPGEENPNPNFRYIGYATIPVPAQFCGPAPSFVFSFAVHTWERTTHANAPADFRFYLDVDRDGQDDYLVLNRDATLNTLGDGRNVAWVVNLSTGSAQGFFFTDHETNSANTVLNICGDQIGMNADNFGDPIDVTAAVFDLYFQGVFTDVITDITISVAGERYLGVFETGGGFEVGTTLLGPNTTTNLWVVDNGEGDSTETGLLLLNRGGAPEGNEAAAIVLND